MEPIDPITLPGLPAPFWFVQFFKVLGFTLHLVPMNLWYAGMVLAVWLHFRGSEHGKRFGFEGWLAKQGFSKVTATGSTSYGGTYRSVAGMTLIVHPASGLGDVVATCGNGQTWIAECKGGIINTRHPGQLSKLRKGLCESVGLSLARTVEDGTEQFAVVPHTERRKSWHGTHDTKGPRGRHPHSAGG